MNLRFSLPLFCLSLLAASAQDDLLPLEDKATREEEKKKNNNVHDRIPVGAVLTNFTVPNFSVDKKRISLLTAEKMVVDSSDELVGEGLKLWLFDDQEEVRSITTISGARYFMATEFLVSQGNIIVRDQADQFYARSRGGVFSLNTGEALMMGPAVMMFVVPEKKSNAMNLKQTLPFAAALQMLVAAPPPEITAEELSHFERAVAPRIIPPFEGQTEMAEAEKNNTHVEERLAEYLKSIKDLNLISQLSAVPGDSEDEEKDPLEDLFKPHPNRIIIHCSKGMYFDGPSAELVYLGKISLKGMGFKLTCNEDLKVLFDQPAKKEGDENAKKDNALGGFGGVGELRQFTASGKLRISGEMNGQTFYLGGDRAIYEKGKNQIIVRGDQMAFKLAEENGIASTDKDAYAVVKLVGENQVTVQFSKGNWVTVIEVPEKDSKKK